MLSTLSITDDSDEQNNKIDDVASYPEQITDGTANTVSYDSVTSNAPTTRDSDEAKKKQESDSHGDLDSHPPHLSGKILK